MSHLVNSPALRSIDIFFLSVAAWAPALSRLGSASVGPVTGSWQVGESGVLQLPSGRLVRGRGLHRTLPGGAAAEFGLYLLGALPPALGWESRWVRWPDLWLPTDRVDAVDALRELWRRAETERVEVACGGGRGRTGTALACLA